MLDWILELSYAGLEIVTINQDLNGSVVHSLLFPHGIRYQNLF